MSIPRRSEKTLECGLRLAPSTVTLVTLAFTLMACVGGKPRDTVAFVQAQQQSAAYHRGYADGCDTANYAYARAANARDKVEFEKDPDYREGWVTGSANCKDTVLIVNTGKPNDHLTF